MGAAHVSRRRRVLIIDEHVDAAESLAEVLRLAGHRVEVAFSADDGLQMARALLPEVVVCELRLRSGGWQLARAIRRHPRLRATRVIAVTVYARPQDVDLAGHAGFDGCLAKPADPEELMRLMHA